MKEISVAFVSKKLKNEFDSLREGKFEDKKLYKFINRALDNLKMNPMCGNKIPKKLWPKPYVQNTSLVIYGNMICLMHGD